MKKIFASLAAIGVFAGYVFTQRDDSSYVATNTAPTIDTPTSTPVVTPPIKKPVKRIGYKDGQYIGPVTDAYYGSVKIQATVKGGSLTDVTFLQYPNDNGTSRRINENATPLLRSEAITAQNANVDGVSGATQTSRAFRESLTSIFAQAQK